MIVKPLGDSSKNYISPLPDKYRWRNWASNSEGLTGDDLKNFIDNDLFPALQNLEPKTDDQRSDVVRSVFEDAYNYMKSGQLLARSLTNKTSICGGSRKTFIW